MTRANAGHFEPAANRWANRSDLFQKTHDLLKDYGLNDEDIRMVESGEADWDIGGNNLLILLHHDGG